jgi:hypothetical protein
MKANYITERSKYNQYKDAYSIPSKSSYQFKQTNQLLSEAKVHLSNLNEKIKDFQSKIKGNSNELTDNIGKYRKNVDIDSYRDSTYFNTSLKQDKLKLHIKKTNAKYARYFPIESGDKFMNTDFSTHLDLRAESVNIKPITYNDSFLDMSDIIDDIVCIRDKTHIYEDRNDMEFSLKLMELKNNEHTNHNDDIMHFINEYETENDGFMSPSMNRINHVDTMTIFQSKAERRKISKISEFNLSDINNRYFTIKDNIVENVISDEIINSESKYNINQNTQEKKQYDSLQYEKHDKVTEKDIFENKIATLRFDKEEITQKDEIFEENLNCLEEGRQTETQYTFKAEGCETDLKYSTDEERGLTKIYNPADDDIVRIQTEITEEKILNDIVSKNENPEDTLTPEKLNTKKAILIKDEDYADEEENHDDSYIINEIIKNSHLRFSSCKDDENKVCYPTMLSDKSIIDLSPMKQDNNYITQEVEKKKVLFCEDLTFIGYLENLNVKNIIIIDEEGNILKEESNNRRRHRPILNKIVITKPIIKQNDTERTTRSHFWHSGKGVNQTS